jgi:hypothetical protein
LLVYQAIMVRASSLSRVHTTRCPNVVPSFPGRKWNGTQTSRLSSRPCTPAARSPASSGWCAVATPSTPSPDASVCREVRLLSSTNCDAVATTCASATSSPAAYAMA